MVVVDAVVLAGGRSSRLGGVGKHRLVLGGETLLGRALAAAAPARNRVVVGDPDGSSGVLSVREEPAYSGPAAAVAAGLDALADASDGAIADAVLVLACDMPFAARAVDALVAALPGLGSADGLIAVDAEGRPQPLAALYRTATLRAAAHTGGGLEGASMTRLIEGLRLIEVPVPAGSTDDVDTWEDAARFGIGKDGIHE